MGYQGLEWARRQGDTWFTKNRNYKIEFNRLAYRDYRHTVYAVEYGDGVETPAEMYHLLGNSYSLKKAKEIASEAEYNRYSMLRKETARIVNALDWDRVNK